MEDSKSSIALPPLTQSMASAYSMHVARNWKGLSASCHHVFSIGSLAHASMRSAFSSANAIRSSSGSLSTPPVAKVLASWTLIHFRPSFPSGCGYNLKVL